MEGNRAVPQSQDQWIATLVSFGLLAFVLLLRMRRMGRARPLRVERLWMLPAFYALIVGMLYWAHPPHGAVWIYAAFACLIGALLGWWRGQTMRISVDPATHAVSQQGSRAAMLFILVLVGIRYAARIGAEQMSGGGVQGAYVATDILLALGLGFIVTQRLEMGLRARRLLAAARAERGA